MPSSPKRPCRAKCNFALDRNLGEEKSQDLPSLSMERAAELSPKSCASVEPKGLLRYATLASDGIGDVYVPLHDGIARSENNGLDPCDWWHPTYNNNTKPPRSRWWRYGVPCLTIFAYYAIGFLFYLWDKGWQHYPRKGMLQLLLESMYFSTVLMSTVGYGDRVPYNDYISLTFTAFYALAGVTLAATAAAKLLPDTSVWLQVLDDIASVVQHGWLLPGPLRRLLRGLLKGIRGLLKPAESVGLLDEKAHRARKRRVLKASVTVFMFWLLLGVVVNGYLQDRGSMAPWYHSLCTGFYLSVITLTTIGFGDFVPKSNFGKVFDIFYILIGVPIGGNALLKIASSFCGGDSEEQIVDLVQGMNDVKLQTMLKFQEDMEKAGCCNKVDMQVSRFEFIMFVLARNGIVGMDTIAHINANFDQLDKDRSNFLDFGDLASMPSLSVDRGSGAGEFQDDADSCANIV